MIFLGRNSPRSIMYMNQESRGIFLSALEFTPWIFRVALIVLVTDVTGHSGNLMWLWVKWSEWSKSVGSRHLKYRVCASSPPALRVLDILTLFVHQPDTPSHTYHPYIATTHLRGEKSAWPLVYWAIFTIRQCHKYLSKTYVCLPAHGVLELKDSCTGFANSEKSV